MKIYQLNLLIEITGKTPEIKIKKYIHFGTLPISSDIYFEAIFTVWVQVLIGKVSYLLKAFTHVYSVSKIIINVYVFIKHEWSIIIAVALKKN